MYLKWDKPCIEFFHCPLTNRMEYPKVVQKELFFEAELGIVHEVNSHQWRRIKAELSMIGVLWESYWWMWMP